MTVTATIKQYFPLRGFGFAKCDDGAPDFFVHVNDADKDFLHIGDRIECEVKAGERGPIGKNIPVTSFAS